jgi:DNA-binding transcriptional regulator YdaS (Cro superfamily)
MQQPTSPLAAVAQEAVAAAGGSAVIARQFGITVAAITLWKKRGIPAGRVLVVERLTGISRHKLRPDVFGVHG